jgi:hypothetical protein
MNYIWKKNDKHQSKEHVNHIQDRQNSTCEKYLTARSPQYHVFQALSKMFTFGIILHDYVTIYRRGYL